ncbi:putative reverse transcriptase domain-containing protein [Tanacetum coccineum]
MRAGILTNESSSYGTLSKNNEKRKALEETSRSGRSWRDNKKAKVGISFMAIAPPRNYSDHLHNTCSKMNRAPGQAGNLLALEGNPLQDPKVVTSTFSLNDHFDTVLFDSGADFSFISTEFVHLLNVKPSVVNPGYVIEVADGKKVEVDRIIRSGILRVEWERTLGANKALMNAKVDEPKLSDISVVRDFVDVFPEDLSGLPPQ